MDWGRRERTEREGTISGNCFLRRRRFLAGGDSRFSAGGVDWEGSEGGVEWEGSGGGVDWEASSISMVLAADADADADAAAAGELEGFEVWFWVILSKRIQGDGSDKEVIAGRILIRSVSSSPIRIRFQK